MKWIVLAFAVLSISSVQAEEPKTDAKTNTVIAEGVGKDEKEAKKAAFRDAVSKVVGTLINAETLIKNDKIISEEILEYSGGFVSEYEIIKQEKTDGDLIRIRMKATVERLQLINKLQKSKVTITEVKGTDLLAEKMTKEEARKNATELLAKLFEDVPKLMQAEVVGKPKLNAKGDAIVLDLNLSADAKQYAEFVKKATPLLEKLAIKTESVLLTAERPGSIKGSFEYPRNVPDTFQKRKVEANAPNKGWAIWMVTFLDSKQEKARWNLYWVDSEIEKSIKPLQGQIHLQITLHDAKDELITEDEIVLPNKPNGGLPPQIDPGLPLLSRGGFFLYRTFPRDLNVDGEIHKSATLLLSPFTMHFNSYDPYSLAGPIFNTEYVVTLPIQRKIKITEKELERVKTIKASMTLK